MKIQTKALHFSADAQLINSVEQKFLKLKAFFTRVNEVLVVLKLENTHKKKTSVAEVKVYMPQGVVYIKENCKTFEGAIIKALVSLKLQLLRYSPPQRSYCLI